jgi:hypothetical protein
MLWDVYSTIRDSVDNLKKNYRRHPNIDNYFKETLLEVLESKYSLVASPYFLKTFLSYYIMMLENIDFFLKECSCLGLEYCNCSKIVNKFMLKCDEGLFFSNNCLALGERVEKLFQRKHDQLNDSEVELVDQYKKEIVPPITHVIDCEAYTIKDKVLLREVSVCNVRTGECKSYQIYLPNTPISEKYHGVRYQIYNIHGIPIVRDWYNQDFYRYYEI